MTTTQTGTVHTIFGIDSIDSAIRDLVGDFAADFDLDAAAEGYRDHLEGLLPVQWSVTHSGDVLRAIGSDDIDVQEVRELQAVSASEFDISRYAIS